MATFWGPSPLTAFLNEGDVELRLSYRCCMHSGMNLKASCRSPLWYFVRGGVGESQRRILRATAAHLMIGIIHFSSLRPTPQTNLLEAKWAKGESYAANLHHSSVRTPWSQSRSAKSQ